MPSDVSEIDIKALRKELTEKWEERFGASSQCFSILTDFLDRFVKKTERGSLSIEDCRSQLESAANLLDSMHNSLDRTATDYHRSSGYRDGTKDLWRPSSQGTLPIRPINWGAVSPVDRMSLDHDIKDYLQRKELQHDLIDWCLVNALLFHELATFREDIRSGEAYGKWNLAHYFSGGVELKTAAYQIALIISGFLLRWIIPPSIIFALFHFEYNTAAQYFGGAYALYLAYRILTLPYRWKARRQLISKLKKVDEIETTTRRAWGMSGFQVYSPKRLMDLVLEAEKKGGVFLPSIHSILLRAIQRDPTTLSS